MQSFHRDISLIVESRDGLATLGSEAIEIVELLDEYFVEWAGEVAAHSLRFPPLLRVGDLEEIDYFENFPHLALLSTALRTEALGNVYAVGGRTRVVAVPPEHLRPAGHALPSAACYNVFFYLQGQSLDSELRITTRARCFRNEEQFDTLRRLWAFDMREIIYVGSIEGADRHLASSKERVLALAERLELPLEVRRGFDPFFERRGPRAVMQTVAPVKEEFVFGGDLAIASLNSHRNFFGERCSIHLGAEQPAFSSCVAFGLERWLQALSERFGGVRQARLAVKRQLS